MKKLLAGAFVLTIALVVAVGGISPAALASQEAGDPAAALLQGDYSGHTLVLGYAEIITDPMSGEAGRVEYFQRDLGNGQLSHDFVYNDPRATWRGGNTAVTYGVKTGKQSSDAHLTNQLGWMDASITIWNSQSCANLGLKPVSVSNGPGLVENFFNTGVIDIGLVEADLTQVGFLGVSAIFPPDTSTLGVTYTLFWVDANGNYTDINNDGKIDLALREIYYNDQYEWADDGTEGTQPDGTRVFDFPTVAIHEAGHGVSMAHFGNIGRQNGTLVANPRSIMNAIYGGTLRQLTGRDNGALCSNWAQWPNN